jgi:hypothetical protein
MDTRRERPVPCLPLRSDHPYSSSVVKKSSDLENQIGRMYFRSDPVKYCRKQADTKGVLETITAKLKIMHFTGEIFFSLKKN